MFRPDGVGSSFAGREDQIVTGTFNIVMRIVSSVIGLLMVAMGGIWILQGFKIAFLNSFMAGDWHWALYGAILAVVGVAQVVWSNTRQVKA